MRAKHLALGAPSEFEDPVRVVLHLARRAELAGNSDAARVLESTASLLAVALPEGAVTRPDAGRLVHV